MGSTFGRLAKHAALRKPGEVFSAEAQVEKLERNLNTHDLVLIGIGGTVGTGVFALTGQIAHEDAGAASVLCWAIAGFGTLLSGLSYMEMSSRINAAGSTYAYSFFALGELAAFVAGWLLSLEYGIASAGVARVWANKFVAWLPSTGIASAGDLGWLDASEASMLGGVVMGASVVLLLAGKNVGVSAINLVTLLKISLVCFMIIGGWVFFSPEHLNPFLLPERDNGTAGGMNGVLKGSISAFFGYIGFDEVCALGAEARDPVRTLPRAVVLTILGTACLSMGASLSLSVMASSENISPEAGFASAFEQNGCEWASQVVQVGELLTLPVVVVIGFLAQPRVLYAMASDGLLPQIFCEVDEQGRIMYGTAICGAFCLVVAIFVPFKTLNEVISAGILLSFNMTNSAVILTRLRPQPSALAEALTEDSPPHEQPRGSPAVANRLLLLFIVSTQAALALWWYLRLTLWPLSAGCTVVSIGSLLSLAVCCPDSTLVGDEYRVPLVPFLPASAIAFNCFLLCQVELVTLAILAAYILLAVFVYCTYGAWHSFGNLTAWKGLLSCCEDASVGTHRSTYNSPFYRTVFGKLADHISSTRRESTESEYTPSLLHQHTMQECSSVPSRARRGNMAPMAATA